MTRTRLAVLNASYDDVNTPRNFRRELDADLVEIDVRNHTIPSDLDVDGCVVTGSRASIYWDEPWIPPLKEWIASAIDEGMPFLGVCYGHQLLADVLGGSVEDMGEYELGYRDITHTGESRLFEGITTTFSAFTSHSDRVVELPPGATAIASNNYGNHGFELDNVYTVQFHPEYDIQTAIEVTQRKDLSDEKIAEVLEEITEPAYAEACEAKQVFDNFIQLVEERTEALQTAR